MDEIKIVKRGKYYLTPFLEEHIDELCDSLSPESRFELRCLGYEGVREALNEIIHESESYVAKTKNGPIICISGLIFDKSSDCPQMFAMFTKDVKKSFHTMARGSTMLINFFDQTYPMLNMSILDKFSFMLDWASWLGFEPVSHIEYQGNGYVEFVRCNPMKKNVSNKSSRPVMH